MSTDKRGTKILARTFFNQLRTGGYTSNQIIEIATELIALVTTELRGTDKPEETEEISVVGAGPARREARH